MSKRITSGFVLPLGYSFNLDGSMMYQSFAVLFIAQAYNIQMSFSQQLTLLLVLMVTSKGMAGVARAPRWWWWRRRCRCSTCPRPACC